jgi:hypothetical protein
VTAAETAPDADEVERLRAALAVATRSLEAASTGERLTTCDELARLSREVATLRAAYAADLDGLRAEVRRADDERAAWRGLRDAARGMLAALEAPAPVWDADESEHDEHAARLTRALYDIAQRCDVCEEHAATREPATRIACRWRVCDRGACSARFSRAMMWRDLPHAEALRAANAAREALAAP